MKAQCTLSHQPLMYWNTSLDAWSPSRTGVRQWNLMMYDSTTIQAEGLNINVHIYVLFGLIGQ